MQERIQKVLIRRGRGSKAVLSQQCWKWIWFTANNFYSLPRLSSWITRPSPWIRHWYLIVSEGLLSSGVSCRIDANTLTEKLRARPCFISKLAKGEMILERDDRYKSNVILTKVCFRNHLSSVNHYQNKRRVCNYWWECFAGVLVFLRYGQDIPKGRPRQVWSDIQSCTNVHREKWELYRLLEPRGT